MKPITPSTIAVLSSGGVDSNVLVGEYAHQGLRVYPIYFEQGFRWEQAERYWLKAYLQKIQSPMLQPLTVLQFSAHDLFARHWSFNGKRTPGLKSSDPEVYLPGRNLMMLAKAGTFCALHGIGKIALGSLGQNPFPDATPSFFKKISSVISQATQKRIEILAPYRQLKKEQVVEKGIRLKLPLHLSFSCLSPRGMKPCHRCNKCAEFKKVEQQLGVRANV